MFGFISMKDIRYDFDYAMRKAGYVRAGEKCQEWGITTKRLTYLIQKGYECDNFIVNGVRYVHVDSRKPDIPAKASKAASPLDMGCVKIWPIDYM